MFNVGGYRICEAIGQRRCRTYITRGDMDEKAFADAISDEDTNLQGLAKQGKAIALNHMNGTKGEVYFFNPNRIFTIAERILGHNIENGQHSANDQGWDIMKACLKAGIFGRIKDTITLSALQEKILEEVAVSDIDKAGTYIERVQRMVDSYVEQLKELGEVTFLKTYLDFTSMSALKSNPKEIGLSLEQLDRRLQELQRLKNPGPDDLDSK